MIALFFWVIGVVTIVAQTALLQHLPSWVGRPDFLFVLIVFLAYRFAWVPGIILVFSLSWMMDVVTSIHLGYYPLICLFVFTLLKCIAAGSPVKESTYQIPLLGLSYLAAQFLLHVIYSFGLDQVLPDWQWGRSLQDTFLLMIVAIPLVTIYNTLYLFLKKRQLRERVSRRPSRRNRRSARSM